MEGILRGNVGGVSGVASASRRGRGGGSGGTLRGNVAFGGTICGNVAFLDFLAGVSGGPGILLGNVVVVVVSKKRTEIDGIEKLRGIENLRGRF